MNGSVTSDTCVRHTTIQIDQEKIEYVCPSEPIDDYLRKKTGLSKDEIADIVALRESTADGDLSLLLKDASIEDLTKTHIRKFLIAEGQTEGRIH